MGANKVGETNNKYAREDRYSLIHSLSPRTIGFIKERRYDQSNKSTKDGTRQSTANQCSDPRTSSSTCNSLFLWGENPLKLRTATPTTAVLDWITTGVCVDSSAIATD
jgi:hypothetical protein